MTAGTIRAEATGGAPWGLMAELETVNQVLTGAERVRDAGYTRWDVHTPFPVHGLNDAMGLRMTRLPWLTMAFGVTGCLTGLVMQWWMSAVDYPVIVSGKPLFSLPAFIPICFELTILFSAIGTFVSMIVANGLPKLYHPTFKSHRFRRATADRFYIVIETADPKFDPRRTRELLESLGGTVEELED